MDRRTVLITGAAGRWGRRMGRQLVQLPSVRVLGLDLRAPENPIEGVEYIQADLRDPLLVELLRTEQVEGILHMVFASGLAPDGERLTVEDAFQTNVMGTMELLAAANAAGVQQVVLKSSTMVYGAMVDNPLYLLEDAPLRAREGRPSLAQRYEIEKYVAGFRRSHDLKIAVLRFAGIVGPSGASSLMHYLGQPVPPVLLGFDPLFQVVHEADVVGATLHALATGADGVFNIAAPGVAPLSQLIRMVGRQGLPVAHLLAYQLERVPVLRSRLIRKAVPFALDYLRYTWVADTAKMQAELEYTPRYDLEAAAQDFQSALRLQRYTDLFPHRKISAGLHAFLNRRSQPPTEGM